MKELSIKADLCDFYETGLRKGLSSATLKNYGFCLRRFFTRATFCTVSEAIVWYNEVTKDCKLSTKNTFYSALRFYFEEVRGEKFEIKRPGAKSEPREKISFKQIRKVLKGEEASLRDQLIFLLSYIGMPSKEIMNMRNDEFTWLLPITVDNFPKLLISDFESLLLIQEAESSSKNTKFLFPSRINTGKHISERTVQSIIQKMNLL